MSRQSKDLTGKRFSRLLVLSFIEKVRGQAYWLCRCDCGTICRAIGGNLVYGGKKSCGCLNSETTIARNLKHGQKRRGKMSSEYASWEAMKRRCLNTRDISFPRYGGKGVKVCAEWTESYARFFEDMGKKPDSTYTIDRIDPFGNYEPSNCRWASKKEQRNNTRRNFNANHDCGNEGAERRQDKTHVH